MNPNPFGLTGVGFTDVVPTGVVVNGPVSSSCGGTLAAASNTITLTAAAIAAGGSCTIVVTVTGSTPGIN